MAAPILADDEITADAEGDVATTVPNTGGAGTFTLLAVGGALLPVGIAIDPDTGELSGRVGVPFMPSFVYAEPIEMFVGEVYSIDPVERGGFPQPGGEGTYSVQAGTLPDGVDLDADGHLHGSPVASDGSDVTIRCANVTGYLDQVVTFAVDFPSTGSFEWTDLETHKITGSGDPTDDTHYICVSQSTGNDGTGVISPAQATAEANPYFSPKAACLVASTTRRGKSTFILFKKGDVWDGREQEIDPGQMPGGNQVFGGALLGVDIDHKVVVSSYGSGLTRPKIIQGQFLIVSPAATSDPSGFWALVGIHFAFLDHTHVLQSDYDPAFAIYLAAESGTECLIEDCYLDGYRNNIECGYGISNVRHRGNVNVNAGWTNLGTRGSGLHTGTPGISMLEGNFFDHNGWAPGGFREDGSHNVYAGQQGSTPGGTTAQGNIFSRGCSHGMHHRPGGLSQDNLFLANPIGLQFGFPFYGAPFNTVEHEKPPAVGRRNVFLDGGNIAYSDDPRGFGMIIGGVSDCEVYECIFAHNVSGGRGVVFDFLQGNNAAVWGTPADVVYIHDNIIHKWDSSNPTGQYAVELEDYGGTVQFDDNIVGRTTGKCLTSYIGLADKTFAGNSWIPGSDSPSSTFYINVTSTPEAYSIDTWAAASGEITTFHMRPIYLDPDRTIVTYMASIGETATFEAFVDKCKLQQKGNYDDRFTALVINEYIRDGFEITGWEAF